MKLPDNAIHWPISNWKKYMFTWHQALAMVVLSVLTIEADLFVAIKLVEQIRQMTETFPFQCCREIADPGKWTAGKDDTADPYMIDRMHNILDKLSFTMPLDTFIKVVKQSVHLDGRTKLGWQIQVCLLWNAVHRLEILSKQIDPDAIWKRPKDRIKDAWAVYRGKAVVIYVKRSD